eukprot:gene21950-28997_t
MVAASRTAVLKQGPSGSTAGDDVSMADASVAGAGDGMGLTDEGAEGLLSQLGVGLQLIVCGLKHGDLVALRELLVVMMPQLFSLQELAGPALQKLDNEAQLAFIMIKYLDLAPHNIDAVVAATSAHLGVGLQLLHAAYMLDQTTLSPHCHVPAPALQKLNNEAQLAFVMIKYLDLSPQNMEAVVAATSDQLGVGLQLLHAADMQLACCPAPEELKHKDRCLPGLHTPCQPQFLPYEAEHEAA